MKNNTEHYSDLDLSGPKVQMVVPYNITTEGIIN